ncbi:hypothetical protein Tco_0963814 [Tanacetum coccineum]
MVVLVMMMVVLAAVGQQPERRGRENASESEWGSGLGKSEEEEHIWCSPEKSSGKVFQWPEVVAGGGAVVAGGCGEERVINCVLGKSEKLSEISFHIKLL